MTGLEIVGAVLPSVVTALQEFLGEYISLADLHEELNERLDFLLDKKRNKEKEASRDKQKRTSGDYRSWRKRVLRIEARVKHYLEDRYEKVRKNTLRRLWKTPHLVQKMKKALDDVNELHRECPTEILVDYEPPERVIKEDVESIKEYPTLTNAFEEIQRLLRSNGVKCVALHGKIGVGKTTIMKHLNNLFCDSSHINEFDMVVFIKVTVDEQTDEHVERLNVLQKIADRMEESGEGHEYEVAQRIQRALKDKRYLLILDGIRHKPDGILWRLGFSKDLNDSKVVLTTHDPLALKTEYVDRTFELKPLKHREAWDMFREIVCDDLLLQHDRQNARLVCKRFCGCLPLLIYHIAICFDPRVPSDCQKALNELTPWPKVGVEGLAQLYQHLKISHDMLCPIQQKIFLYASLYPANSNIYTLYLVECCIVLGFLSDGTADTGYSILRTRVIDEISSHPFLEQGELMRYVQMNYLYWQLASYILSEDSNLRHIQQDSRQHAKWFSRIGRQDSRQHAKWFSRIGSKSDDLPTKQNCGSLEALLLQKNMKLVKFPRKCFKSMCNLLVLNLYGSTKISKLPPLKGLTNLKAFYLNGCSELEIHPNEIEPLKCLEVFDIRDTKVNFVPCLESLRCLRISCIASGNYDRISMLKKFEELTIEVKSLQEWCNGAQCIIDAVASLKKPITVRCSFYSSKILDEFLKASEAWRHEKSQSLPFQLLYDVKTQSQDGPSSLST